MENKNEKKISAWLMAVNAGLTFIVIALIFMLSNVISLKKITTFIANTPSNTSSEVATHAFDNMELSAKSVYVYDVVNQKVLYEKNEIAQLPLASITKLMTAVVATNLVPKDSHITIQKEFLVADGGTVLNPGETWDMKNLLDFSLVVSSNDGARSLASVIGATINNTDFNIGREDFIKDMNTEAQTLGLKQTYFLNESGLDESSTESGGYGSAVDVANLMAYMLKNKPDVLEVTRFESTTVSSLTNTHIATNTDTVINKIPGLLASKTGYTALAGGNLVVAFDASIGHPVIVVVLGSTEQGRFSDVVSLVNASMKYESGE